MLVGFIFGLFELLHDAPVEMVGGLGSSCIKAHSYIPSAFSCMGTEDQPGSYFGATSAEKADVISGRFNTSRTYRWQEVARQPTTVGICILF